MGSLHFNLTESDIRQVFEPFGELEFVDLHRDPVTGRSKGYAFIQYVDYSICQPSLLIYCRRYKRSEDAKMALEQMEGFELAGRTVNVLLLLTHPIVTTSAASSKHCSRERNRKIYSARFPRRIRRSVLDVVQFKLFFLSECPSLGGNLNAASRQALMHKLARIDNVPAKEETM